MFIVLSVLPVTAWHMGWDVTKATTEGTGAPKDCG